MRTDLFDFELPAANIALRPASPRDSARMLVVQPGAALEDNVVADLPQWLRPGDQLVVNDTKVIAAQLTGRRIGRDVETKIEATLIKRLDGSRWQALVKPAKRLIPGDTVRFGSEGRVCLLGHLDAQVEHKARCRRDHAVVYISWPSARSGHRRTGRAAAATLYRFQTRAG
ncbi:S-adenosylmethionine:tRNA-ribosyltransferase-isomerase (queuine synthetase) [Nitrobacteraceae bacterium AZCC 2299]